MNKKYLLIICGILAIIIIFGIFYANNSRSYYKNTIIQHYNPKIVILIISSVNNILDTPNKKRWKKEKNIWLKSIKDNKFTNIDIFFLESSDDVKPNTASIKNNTIYCGIKDSFIPGILQKTLLALKVLPTYDFYVRTNLSTVVDYKELNSFLQTISLNIFFSTGFEEYKKMGKSLCKEHQTEKYKIVSEIKDNNLPYYGDTKNTDNTWFSGWSIIFTKNYVKILIKYLDIIPYILESNVPDDVLLGILMGKHDKNINNKCNTKCNKKTSNTIFYRCKNISKKAHEMFENVINSY